MSFLYPLFLIAGISLAIPVLIHLFNLRRYKVIYFPHTRFLKNIQLRSRKQSQVRYKWLLAARLLFLAFLIAAFAQPVFNAVKRTTARQQVIYIDNSYGMSVKKGMRTLLDIAKDAARQQVRQAATGSRFLLLTNDKPGTYQPVTAEEALIAINSINVSPISKTAGQILPAVQLLVQTTGAMKADVYYYSDFQKSIFPGRPETSLLRNINFYGIPVQATDLQNIYIDTAYFATPVLQAGQNNELIVKVNAVGKLPKEPPVLQLQVNGQVKSAASITFNDRNESTDTLSFQVNDAEWQRMTLSLNDASMRFDDTFRIAARSAPSLSVLVLNEGQPSPYIQAAFRAYNGFRINQEDINAAPADWNAYNLVILNNLTHISDALAKQIAASLQSGQSICLFPGKTSKFGTLNEGLKQVGDIQVTGIDTTMQTVASLQQGSSLVKDLFERIPDNVQLPVATWHYIIASGLSANRQSVLSFRNGDPFLAKYTPSKGQLYLCATSADLQSGNFPGSYFFVPFLYEMAMQSRGSSIYAITAGAQQPVYLPMSDATQRNVVHVYAPGIDAIPAQRPNGAGLDVYLDQAVQQPGFYTLRAAGSDTAVIALNAPRAASKLDVWDVNALKKQWKGPAIQWLSINNAGAAVAETEAGNFPLWKVCVILALLMLAAETIILAGSFRKQTIVSQ